jgi:hypothetical protein
MDLGSDGLSVSFIHCRNASALAIFGLRYRRCLGLWMKHTKGYL